MASSAAERIQQLHESAIEQLIDAHKRRTDERLVLAIRFEIEHPDDVFLLEALDDFPGGDDDELLTTEFDRSPNLLILGKLHLSLGSPAQVINAIARDAELIGKLRRGNVLWSDGSPTATRLRQAIFDQVSLPR